MEKIKNTLENKAKFFALYWGQKVFKTSEIQDIPHRNNFGRWIKKSDFLELTSLSQISDEDAIQLARLRFGNDVDVHQIEKLSEVVKFKISKTAVTSCERSGVFLRRLYQQELDFLRSKEIATPWMGLSVEHLIEYGWVKLKEASNG